jgi:hypothetical protein
MEAFKVQVLSKLRSLESGLKDVEEAIKTMTGDPTATSSAG